MAPIPVKNNTSYGEPTLVTSKYSPLDIKAAGILKSIPNDYKSLFTNRINRLRESVLFPARLRFFSKNWETIRDRENGANALPPIVVVSSNRAEWIKTCYAQATGALGSRANFQNVSDKTAFGSPGQEQYSLWYDPRRVNDANRHVYLLVHASEYSYYQKQLKGTPFTIVGWTFGPSKTTDGKAAGYLGFGATRFAAIQLGKYLFNNLPRSPLAAARQKMWLVDDNVVFLNLFPGFDVVEAGMTTKVWGLGFGGASSNSPISEIIKKTVGNSQPLGTLKDKGLLQQCVLWNVGQLQAQSLNFSPYFVTSNEDSSFSNYLQNEKKLKLTETVRIYKAQPKNDTHNVGGQSLGRQRQTILNTLAAIENNCSVQPDTGGTVPLKTYIETTVLPNAIHKTEDPGITQSKAVEQILAQVVLQEQSWVDKGFFKPEWDQDIEIFKTL